MEQNDRVVLSVNVETVGAALALWAWPRAPATLMHSYGGPGERTRHEHLLGINAIELVVVVAKLAIDADASFVGNDSINLDLTEQTQHVGDTVTRARASKAKRTFSVLLTSCIIFI